MMSLQMTHIPTRKMATNLFALTSTTLLILFLVFNVFMIYEYLQLFVNFKFVGRLRILVAKLRAPILKQFDCVFLTKPQNGNFTGDD